MKKLPHLDVVVIGSSVRLKSFLVILYLIFFGTVCCLVWPYIQQRVLWSILPLLSGLLLFCSWQQQRQTLQATRRIWFGQRGWLLETAAISQPVFLSGEVLVWPWVIILGFKPYKSAGQTLRLVVMRDAVSDEDFRRLSCWLRVCLKPQH